jgi:hypothetical protein
MFVIYCSNREKAISIPVYNYEKRRNWRFVLVGNIQIPKALSIEMLLLKGPLPVGFL